uniref:Uncharacterized protein n=1 Tax=Setaria italica TaxID=4555 RepID=K3ZKW3_SETIT
MQIDKSKGYKSIYRSICIRLILISLAVEIGDKKQLKNMYTKKLLIKYVMQNGDPLPLLLI